MIDSVTCSLLEILFTHTILEPVNIFMLHPIELIFDLSLSDFKVPNCSTLLILL